PAGVGKPFVEIEIDEDLVGSECRSRDDVLHDLIEGAHEWHAAGALWLGCEGDVAADDVFHLVGVAAMVGCRLSDPVPRSGGRFETVRACDRQPSVRSLREAVQRCRSGRRTTEHHGNLAHRLGQDIRILDENAGASMVDGVWAPDSLEHIHQLVDETAAVGATGAGRLELVRRPASAEPCDNPAATDLIDRRQALGQLEWRVCWRDQHAVPSLTCVVTTAAAVRMASGSAACRVGSGHGAPNWPAGGTTPPDGSMLSLGFRG